MGVRPGQRVEFSLTDGRNECGIYLGMLDDPDPCLLILGINDDQRRVIRFHDIRRLCSEEPACQMPLSV